MKRGHRNLRPTPKIGGFYPFGVTGEYSGSLNFDSGGNIYIVQFKYKTRNSLTFSSKRVSDTWNEVANFTLWDIVLLFK